MSSLALIAIARSAAWSPYFLLSLQLLSRMYLCLLAGVMHIILFGVQYLLCYVKGQREDSFGYTGAPKSIISLYHLLFFT